MPKWKPDEKDISIIKCLKEDCKQPIESIGKKTGIPPTTVHNRIKKMEKEKVILNSTVNVDLKKLGKAVTAFVGVKINYNVMAKKIKQDEVAKEIKKIDGIEYVAVITGDTDIMAKAVAKDTEELNTIITKKLRNIDGVDKTQTMIVLEQI